MTTKYDERLLNILSTKKAQRTPQVVRALGLNKSKYTHTVRCALYGLQSRRLAFFSTFDPHNAGWLLTPIGVRARTNPNL